MLEGIKNRIIQFYNPQKLISLKMIGFFKEVEYNVYQNWVSEKAARFYSKPSSEIGSLIFWKQEFEKNEIGFFSSLINSKKFKILLGIGAYIWLHVTNWAEQCSGVEKIHAFEPAREKGSILQQNLSLRAIGAKKEVVGIVVSDYNGKADFYDVSENTYSSLKDTQRKKTSEVYKVPVQTPDSFVIERKFPGIDFIKMDVESFEHQVIKGEAEILKKWKPDLFVEIYKGLNSNTHLESTVAFLHAFWYKAYVMKIGLPGPFVSCDEKYYNYYFLVQE
ncbi:MAG: FkbM family methyltransferase [Chitinophagaceae bacterium]